MTGRETPQVGDLTSEHLCLSIEEVDCAKKILSPQNLSSYLPNLACESHVLGLMSGVLARKYLSKGTLMVSEMNSVFNEPIIANENYLISWKILGVALKPSFNGYHLLFDGVIISADTNNVNERVKSTVGMWVFS